jgi:Ca-activated chloride channel family protein
MAIARCAVVLRASSASSKIVVLLTDGEENVARADLPQEIAPLEAAQLCAELGVRVYTIAAGIGRQQANGQWVELDTGPVRRVAELTGGAFFAARDAGAVSRVYAAIGELERSAFAAPRFEFADRFVAFLVVGLLLWALGRLAAATLWSGLP